MRFVRIASMLLLILCLVDVAQDCAIAVSLTVLDDDDHRYFYAVLSVPTLFWDLYLSIRPSTLSFTHAIPGRSMYRPIRQ